MRKSLYFFGGVALAVALVVMCRFAVTDLGVKSFGRVWHFYVSYSDFGFVRRSLVGSILHLTHLNGPGVNEYWLAYFVHAGMIVCVTIVLVWAMRDIAQEMGVLSIATVFLSPAAIIQLGYSTGSQDIFVLFLVFVGALLVRKREHLMALILVELLVHEVSLFLVPAQLVAFGIRGGGDQKTMLSWGVPFASVAVAATYGLSVMGVAGLDQPSYEAVMSARMPQAAYQHPLWSGYFELSSTVQGNVGYRSVMNQQIVEAKWFVLGPVVYMALLILRNWRFAVEWRWVMLVGCLSPLFAFALASDLYRWIGMCCNAALLIYVAMWKAGSQPRWKSIDVALLTFFLVAPMGGAEITRPYPMQQFVLEKVLHR